MSERLVSVKNETAMLTTFNEADLSQIFDLRKKYNLTTIIEDDARTSYDFHHLLLRASNIHLIYNSVSEGIDTGEKSRYIYQFCLLYTSPSPRDS